MTEKENSCALRLENVGLVIDDREILRDISLDLARGDCLAVVGSNGSGKSSFTKLCAGVLPPTSGTVTFDGEDPYIGDRQSNVGFVFQVPVLVSNLSLRENVALPLRYHGQYSEEEIANRVDAALDAAGLSRNLDARPAAVSMMLRVRTGVALALVMEPPLIVMDDPFAKLDGSELTSVLEVIRARSEGTAVLVAATDRHCVEGIADRMMTLDAGTLKR